MGIEKHNLNETSLLIFTVEVIFNHHIEFDQVRR